jgi:flagellar hook-associated protein 2
MAANAPNTLAQIGVTLQKDGTMAIDTKKLDAAIGANLNDVAALFGGDGNKGGFARRLSDAVDRVTGTNGALSAAASGIEKSMKDLSKRYDAISARADATVERYRMQFTQLDKVVAEMNRTSSYLTQQFAAINNMNNNSSKK